MYAQVCFATEAQGSMPGDSHVMIQIDCIGFMGILVPHHIGFCFIKFLAGFQDLDGQSSSPSPIFFPKDLHDWAVLTTRIDGIYHLPQKLLEAGGPLPELGTASRREGSEFLFLSMSHMLQNCVICPLFLFHVIILHHFSEVQGCHRCRE